ncbi:MAG: hypothetical protein ABIZ34_00055, partial [Candidatus Limnocylindrales bacterium]
MGPLTLAHSDDVETLPDLVAALASDLGVVGEAAGSTVEYARDGRPFAVVDGSALELCMNPEVAFAA